MNALRRLWASDSGQAVLEVAMSMPLLVMLLAGAIDLGRYSQLSTTIASMAHAGALYGSVSASNAANTTQIVSAADADAGNASGYSAVAASWYQCSGAAPNQANAVTAGYTCPGSTYKVTYVSVTASAYFKPLFLFFLSSAGAKTSTVVMPVAGT
jgi:Flp pilus assembly protein TadG